VGETLRGSDAKRIWKGRRGVWTSSICLVFISSSTALRRKAWVAKQLLWEWKRGERVCEREEEEGGERERARHSTGV
jgi:hypothetical protein